MAFRIIRNDITKVKSDAIVNTVNPDVAIGGGVETAIYEAAGKERLLKERVKLGYLQPGTVAVTPAFELDAKWIIHASGPVWRGGTEGEKEILRSCYDKALKMAVKKRCHSIAFPLLASGSYGFPKEVGISIAVQAFTEFLMKNEMEILLVVFEEKAFKISGDLFRDVDAYVDDHYVNNRLEYEYLGAAPRPTMRGSGQNAMPMMSESVPDAMPMMSDAMCATLREEEDTAPKAPKASVLAPRPVGGRVAAKKDSLEDILKKMYTDSFAKHLQQIINKKGYKNSEVYALANISKQYFSKLMKGQVNPSKEKVMALAIGMRMNMDETIDLLRLAGYAFSPVSQTDVVVEYFIRHQKYNVIELNMVLFDFGLPALSE